MLQDAKLLTDTIQNLQSHTHTESKHTIKFGLAFDSKQLATQAIGKDPNITSAYPLPLSNIQHAYKSLPLGVCVVPANLHTLDSAKELAHAIQNITPKRQIDIILTELLRVYSHKPGYVYSDYESYGAYTHTIDKTTHSIWKLYDSLITQHTQPITLSSTSHIITPSVPPIPGVSTEVMRDLIHHPDLSIQVKEASVDVHVAVDRCHQLERAFLAKVRLCMGFAYYVCALVYGL
ncbi:hypothetical protein EON63_02940 [archaeon]|nr:MAG: hypothetical protein EON63_02940 [archaeon]